MSLAFRIFLIMLLGALGLWGYRLRAPSLDRWVARVFDPDVAVQPERQQRAATLPDARLDLRFVGNALPQPAPRGRPLDPAELEDAADSIVLEMTDVEIFEWHDPPPEADATVFPGVQAQDTEPPLSERGRRETEEPREAEGLREAEEPGVDLSTYEELPGFPEDPVAPGTDDSTVLEDSQLEEAPLVESSLVVDGPSDPVADDNAPETVEVEQSAEQPPGVVHVVRDGETLWKIAGRYYGAGHRYQHLVDANPALMEKRGDQVRVGDEIVVPVVDGMMIEQETFKEEVATADDPVEAPSGHSSGSPGTNPPDARPPAAGGIVHRVKKNETLSKIASHYFPGERAAWNRIFRANEETLESPDLVREGLLLKIPAAPGTE